MVKKDKKQKIESYVYYIVAYGDKVNEKETCNLDAVFLSLYEAEEYIEKTVYEIYEMEMEDVKFCSANLIKNTKNQEVLFDVIYDDGNVSYPLFTVVKKKVNITI